MSKKHDGIDGPEIDLRRICRNSDRYETRITYKDDMYNRREWLRLGQASLTPLEGGDVRRWYLKSYLAPRNAEETSPTDFEHDSAFACRLPLVGVELKIINHGNTVVTGWIDPNAYDGLHEDFHVPADSDYDPRSHPNAVMCEVENCIKGPLKNGYGPHIIVPEDFYVPPFCAELYNEVRGRFVEIMFRVLNDNDS